MTRTPPLALAALLILIATASRPAAADDHGLTGASLEVYGADAQSPGWEIEQQDSAGRVVLSARQWREGRRVTAEYTSAEVDLFIECDTAGLCTVLEDGVQLDGETMSEAAAKLLAEVETLIADAPSLIGISIHSEICSEEAALDTTPLTGPETPPCSCRLRLDVTLN